MHMRTREDMAEVKEKVKTIASSQERFEKRQDHFEQEIWREMEARHSETKESLARISAETAERIDEIESKVNTIREERIAEKAQWRGPEKAIAALVAVAGAIAAIASIMTFMKAH
uniref:DUF1640 domain-containing protein n=1 Tax=Caulobacter phage BL57 TaxID=3348355 RepID=A0AB74UI68_9VIRU